MTKPSIPFISKRNSFCSGFFFFNSFRFNFFSFFQFSHSIILPVLSSCTMEIVQNLFLFLNSWSMRPTILGVDLWSWHSLPKTNYDLWISQVVWSKRTWVLGLDTVQQHDPFMDHQFSLEGDFYKHYLHQFVSRYMAESKGTILTTKWTESFSTPKNDFQHLTS
jgi:hypothetical protein